jgi:hypothetical protein
MKMIRKKLTALLLCLSLVATMTLAGAIPVVASAATVTTDKADYEPEEIVIVTGTGFSAGGSVLVEVTRPDGSIVHWDPVTQTFVPGGETVTADAAGGFVYDYVLDGVVGSYTVNASDGTNSATCTFFDTPVPYLHPEPLTTPGTSNTITWDAVSNATQYEAQASTDSTFTAVDFYSGILYPAGGATESYTFAGLSSGATYYYRVRAHNPGHWPTPSKWSSERYTVFSTQGGTPPSDTVAPAISGTSGSGSGPGSPLTVTTQASDNVGVSTVELHYLSTTYLEKTITMVLVSGTAQNGTYQATIPAADVVSDLEYYVSAEDGAGNASTAGFFAVPSISGISPTSGPVGTSVTISGADFGTTQGSSSVTLNGTAVTVTSWSDTQIVVAVPVGATDGSIVVTTGSGTSNGVLFDVTVVDAAPTVSISNPADGSTVSGTVNVTATASDDNGVSKVEFYIHDVLAATDTGAPYEYSWDTTSHANGACPVKAIAYDTASQTAQDVNNITVSNIVDNPPAVTIDSPADGSTVSGTVNVTATASDDNGVSSVEFYVDDALRSTDAVAPYAYSWDTTLETNAAHAVKAIAYDTLGQTATDINNVTVNNVVNAPIVISVDPIAGPIGTPVTINGSRFGATQGSSTATFNGAQAVTINYWSDTQIIATVPLGASTGPVVVTTADGPSNSDVVFTVVTAAFLRTEQSDASVSFTGTGGVTWKDYSNPNYSAGSTRYFIAPGSATFTFTGTGVSWWSVKCQNRGIAQVYIDGVLDATINLYTPVVLVGVPVYTKAGLTAGTHTLQIVATGNKSAVSTNMYVDIDAFDVYDAPVVSRTVRHEETSSSFVDWGAYWNDWLVDPNYSGGSTRYINELNASASLTFTGTSVTWIAARTMNRGIANVYIDDVLQGSVDPYSATTAYRQPVFTASGLFNTEHTIRVVVTGDKNPLSTNTYIDIDAFDVVDGAGATTRYENIDVQWVGNWKDWNFDPNYSGYRTRYVNETGASAMFTFVGTQVSWIAVKCSNRGIARVYIDGVLQGTVDLYNAATLYRQTVYTSPVLADGTHTIKVEVTGTKNASATNTYIDVDAFDVVTVH